MPTVQQPAQGYVDLLHELRVRGLRDGVITALESSSVRDAANDLFHVLDLEVLRHFVELRRAMLQKAYLRPQVQALMAYNFRPAALDDLVAELRELLRTVHAALARWSRPARRTGHAPPK